MVERCAHAPSTGDRSHPDMLPLPLRTRCANHFGDASRGIEDLRQPDFGDPVSINEDDVPVFWACGVTPQVALENAQPALAILMSRATCW